MEDSFSEARTNDIVEREPRIIERRLVCVERNAARILNHNGLRDYVSNPAKLAFIFAQLLFRLLENFNVSACSVPSNGLPGFIAERFDANQEPSIDPIIAANTRFDLCGLFRGPGLPPPLQ